MYSSAGFTFFHPETPPLPGRVFPIFLPFAGCPKRCLFCAQDVQTGRQPGALTQTLARAEKHFAQRLRREAAPVELAFYGGTFTALPREEQRACLDFAKKWQQCGLVTAVRCSTRPDAVTTQGLAFLRDMGLGMVELGVQSFSNTTLAAAQRGYDGSAAMRGCEIVRESGLSLGIQLMPGLPKLSPEIAREDVARAVSFSPSCMRLYPCLVLQGTELAKMWQRGECIPWALDAAISFLADACLCSWEKGIPVIRMGLAPEEGLEQRILAGPAHPALGSMARGLALARHIASKLESYPKRDAWQVHAPRRYQGEFWGHKKDLVPFYSTLGIAQDRVIWEDTAKFFIYPSESH